MAAIPSNVDRAAGQVTPNLALYEDDSATATYLESMHSRIGESLQAKRQFGSFLGVYVPCVQTAVNFLIFLRLPWIVGIAGIVQSAILVFVCSLCALLTSISVAAIATNGKLKENHGSGDVYSLLARNIGPEFGGAIGVLFFLAKTMQVSFALLALAEILVTYVLPESSRTTDAIAGESGIVNSYRLYAILLLIILFPVCCFCHRCLTFILPFLLIPTIFALLSVVIGSALLNEQNSNEICLVGEAVLRTEVSNENITAVCGRSENILPYSRNVTNRSVPDLCKGYLLDNQPKNLYSNFLYAGESAEGCSGNPRLLVTQDITTNFFVLLSIFVPAVGGVMSLAVINDNLEKPDFSVPCGTIAVQLTSFAVYFVFVFIYGSTTFGPLLRDKYGQSLGGKMVAGGLAWPSHWVVVIGTSIMCLEAGMQELCNSPMLLQSIARDKLIPLLAPFIKSTMKGVPLNAILFSTFMAALGIMIGRVDELAPLVLVLILINYTFVNLACAIQTILRAPNWRPHFRYYHWSFSVIGALLSLFIMFSTKWHYSLVVLIIFALLHKYIEYKGAKQEWGDGLRGLALSTAQYSLLRVEDSRVHPKNWRPQLLVLLKMQPSHDLLNYKLLHFASQLKTGHGLTIAATLLQGEIASQHDREKMEGIRKELKQKMADAKIRGFTEVVLSTNIHKVVGTVLQCVGIAGLRTNTVIIAWPISFAENSHRNGSGEAQFFGKPLRNAYCMPSDLLNYYIIIPAFISTFLMDQ
ncbi:unnamed protein product [Soboliphyme baturini]|uniref:AA_permease domain-containing protein n=1 Tax=Soboliphyme baturini TaxID=241478 RepID=A0A183ID39_9BILA|nr:unnamed protein product [Soboliphyme baturini]